MTLNFPNQSRSYDATLRAVRFWGHDGAMEAAFFVNEGALKRIEQQKPWRSRNEYLDAQYNTGLSNRRWEQ